MLIPVYDMLGLTSLQGIFLVINIYTYLTKMSEISGVPNKRGSRHAARAAKVLRLRVD